MKHPFAASCSNTLVPTQPLAEFHTVLFLVWACPKWDTKKTIESVQTLSTCLEPCNVCSVVKRPWINDLLRCHAVLYNKWRWLVSPWGPDILECYCVFFLQLKTQLTETLSKLETEESERQKVAGDLYKVMIFCLFFLLSPLLWVKFPLVASGALWFFLQAQQSVDLIQGELSKVMDNADGLIENSSPTSQMVRGQSASGCLVPWPVLYIAVWTDRSFLTGRGR